MGGLYLRVVGVWGEEEERMRAEHRYEILISSQVIGVVLRAYYQLYRVSPWDIERCSLLILHRSHINSD